VLSYSARLLGSSTEHMLELQSQQFGVLHSADLTSIEGVRSSLVRFESTSCLHLLTCQTPAAKSEPVGRNLTANVICSMYYFMQYVASAERARCPAGRPPFPLSASFPGV
jgi:hypothetical protein